MAVFQGLEVSITFAPSVHAFGKLGHGQALLGGGGFAGLALSTVLGR